MENEMKNDGAHPIFRSTSASIETIPRKDGIDVPAAKSGTTAVVPNSNNASRLITIHQRIINDIASLQQKWIKKRSRTVYESSKKDTKRPSLSNWQQQEKRDLYKRLYQLRKHRMALAAKVDTAVQQRTSHPTSTVYTQLKKENNNNPSNTNSGISTESDVHKDVGQEGQPMQQTHNSNDTIDTVLLRCNTNDSFGTANSSSDSIWNHIRHQRQINCIQAAYRLLGQSMIVSNHDDNSNQLTIQFDIGNHNCYHCTFDLIQQNTRPKTVTFDAMNEKDNRWNNPEVARTNYTNDDMTTETQLLLQLVNHTLPSAIPIMDILQRAINRTKATTNVRSRIQDDGSTTALPMIPIGTNISAALLLNPTTTSLQEQQDVLLNVAQKQQHKERFRQQLQSLTHEIYHACRAFQIRNETYDFLQQLSTTSSSSDDGEMVPYAIQQLQRKKVPQQQSIYKTIQFQIHHRFSSIDNVQITLQYTTDLCRQRSQQPVSVNVNIISPNNNNRQRNSYRTKSSTTIQRHVYVTEGVVSDVDEHNGMLNDTFYGSNDNEHDEMEGRQYEFIESTIRSFRTLPIQSAIKAVTDEMTEY
jgi:hypothetical protein